VGYLLFFSIFYLQVGTAQIFGVKFFSAFNSSRALLSRNLIMEGYFLGAMRHLESPSEALCILYSAMVFWKISGVCQRVGFMRSRYIYQDYH
jgi:hypothetical protein